MTTRRRVATPAETPSRIPEFGSRQAEAEWFDTHDMADYQDEFQTVKASFASNLSENLNIRFDAESLASLRREAHARGIGPTTLARMWILEHLRGEGTDERTTRG
jgi:predicted DNA binding CopG/RHH family protein